MRRRELLVGAGRGVVGLVLAAATASVTAAGCGRDTEPEIEPLDEPLAQARADAEMALAAVAAAAPALVPALERIADERTRHAEALSNEIARTARTSAPTTTAPGSDATETTTADTPAPPPPRVHEVSDALKRSAATATALATELSGYRAGLLGSIAAACTASATVTLPDRKATP